MGLEQRRIIDHAITRSIPFQQQRLHAERGITGIAWHLDQVGLDQRTADQLWMLEGHLNRPVGSALWITASDDLGNHAVRKRVRRVVLSHAGPEIPDDQLGVAVRDRVSTARVDPTHPGGGHVLELAMGHDLQRDL